MRIDNNTVAIIGIMIVSIIAIITSIRVADNEIATGLIALSSTAIGGVIGYLAKSQVPDNEFIIGTMIDALKNEVDTNNEIISDNTEDNNIKNDKSVD